MQYEAVKSSVISLTYSLTFPLLSTMWYTSMAKKHLEKCIFTINFPYPNHILFLHSKWHLKHKTKRIKRKINICNRILY